MQNFVSLMPVCSVCRDCVWYCRPSCCLLKLNTIIALGAKTVCLGNSLVSRERFGHWWQESAQSGKLRHKQAKHFVPFQLSVTKCRVASLLQNSYSGMQRRGSTMYMCAQLFHARAEFRSFNPVFVRLFAGRISSQTG